MVWSRPVEPERVSFVLPIFRSKGEVCYPSVGNGEAYIDVFGFDLRNLSFFNRSASRSKTSRFCISIFFDCREPLAVRLLSMGDICESRRVSEVGAD